MPHIFAYKGEYFKNAQSQDKFVKPKCMVKEKSRSPEWKDRLIDWVTFYRRNVHRFIQHYFGIKLYAYQIIWIYFMSISDYFITIAKSSKCKIMAYCCIRLCDSYVISKLRNCTCFCYKKECSNYCR